MPHASQGETERARARARERSLSSRERALAEQRRAPHQGAATAIVTLGTLLYYWRAPAPAGGGGDPPARGKEYLGLDLGDGGAIELAGGGAGAPKRSSPRRPSLLSASGSVEFVATAVRRAPTFEVGAADASDDDDDDDEAAPPPVSPLSQLEVSIMGRHEPPQGKYATVPQTPGDP